MGASPSSEDSTSSVEQAPENTPLSNDFYLTEDFINEFSDSENSKQNIDENVKLPQFHLPIFVFPPRHYEDETDDNDSFPESSETPPESSYEEIENELKLKLEKEIIHRVEQQAIDSSKKELERIDNSLQQFTPKPSMCDTHRQDVIKCLHNFKDSNANPFLMCEEKIDVFMHCVESLRS